MRKITGMEKSMQTISELPENPEINKLYYYPEVSNVLNRNTLSYSIDGSLNISVNHM